jgi:hypothetical protein
MIPYGCFNFYTFDMQRELSDTIAGDTHERKKKNSENTGQGKNGQTSCDLSGRNDEFRRNSNLDEYRRLP